MSKSKSSSSKDAKDAPDSAKVPKVKLEPRLAYDAAIEKAHARLQKDVTHATDKLVKALQRRSRHKPAVDPNKPKSPMTAFFLFRKQHHQSIKDSCGKLSMPDIAKKIGLKWKALTDEEKEPYNVEAQKARAQYKLDLAEYEKTKAIKPAGEDVSIPTSPPKAKRQKTK